MGECMRVDNIDDQIIVYLTNIINEDLEIICEQVINKLKKYYGIELKGFYEVTIYYDLNYGMVLVFNLEDLDLYYDYSKVDLHIIKKDSTFLLEIKDILDIATDEYYFYNDKYYLSIKDINVNNLEFGKLVYDTEEILKKAIVCKIP